MYCNIVCGGLVWLRVCVCVCVCVCVVYDVLLCTGTGEPEGMAIHCIHGFVEELVVNDDPEYQV